MHILIKGYYGYKNLGDELILFQLLNWMEDRFEPEEISIESWDSVRLENWIIQHKSFLIPWIIWKLNFLSKPSRKEKIALCLWKRRWLYDLIVFGWGEVVDESRSFLYRWWNLYFQYKLDIKQWNTVLVWWLGTNNKFWTKYLQNFLVKYARFILLRDQNSFELAKNILSKVWENWEEKSEYDWDLTLSLLTEANDIFKTGKIKSDRTSYYLINLSPLCDLDESLKVVKEFADSHKKLQPVYIACNKLEDEKFFEKVQEILPNCEYFDWTQNHIVDILKLFYFAKSGLWARLHFLYILKFFNKNFVAVHSSHKIDTNLSDLDEL